MEMQSDRPRPALHYAGIPPLPRTLAGLVAGRPQRDVPRSRHLLARRCRRENARRRPHPSRRSVQLHFRGPSLGGRSMAGRMRHGDRPSTDRLGWPAVVDRRSAGRHLRLHRRPALSLRSAHPSHVLVASPGAAGRLAPIPRSPPGADDRPAEPHCRMAGRRRSGPQIRFGNSGGSPHCSSFG